MSEKLPQQPQSEEVDLGQLFNAIGKLFERFFSFIGKIFKAIFSAIIYTIKPLVVHFKLVAIALVIATALGFILQKTKKPMYYSNMVVKPHFDSKYQLANNIDYFNSLIGSGDLKELSNIFEIDTIRAKALVSFDFEAGPETQNDLFKEYDEYVMSVDTSLVDELSYKEFVNNRDLLSGRLFSVIVKAHEKDIFLDLEEGFKKTFVNPHSVYKKKVRDTMALIERENLLKQLASLENIQNTYLEVIKNESEKSKVSLDITGGLPLQEEKTATKEYELFLKEQEIRRALNKLNQTIAEENTYFDVLSGFDRIGNKDQGITKRYHILFPALALLLFVLWFLLLKAFNFIKNYE
ncbi:hypothetical protein H8K90_05110 [Winogradskyella echinorum]|uniref:Chain length determinant protein n=1 Tax=Winogradskyella echinorum TaxID=538189 RepID=A0ABR6XZ34_9FLAO|nr:hypothetical protein [Winogradskyella echinorum]MBC3845747.1 hypothetical protein [Winogradskyella echinorum]MBC5750095.1 hypothetical protein [Winogradskyella echinorum]